MKTIIGSSLLALLLLLIFVQAAPPAPSAPPVPAEGRIEWLSWEEAMVRAAEEPRKIMVDVYTDWCGWCKRMDKATFQHPRIAAYVNANFYAVKLVAEQTNELRYKDKSYGFVKRGKRGYHELAALLTGGRLSFPTVVFLDETQAPLQAIGGYHDAAEFEQIVTYFGGDHHRRTPWVNYQRRYVPLREKGTTPARAVAPVNAASEPAEN